MKIQGPGKPPGPPGNSPVDRPSGARAFQVEGPKPAAATEGARGAREAGPAKAAAARPASGPIVELSRAIDTVAAEVRAGRITKADAVGTLIDLTLAKVLPPHAASQTRVAVRQILEQALSDDPALRTRLARLGLIELSGQ